MRRGLGVFWLAAGLAMAQDCSTLRGYVYRIRLPDALRPAASGPEGSGGGFFVSAGGVYLTARHLFEQSPYAARVRVEVDDGDRWFDCPVESVLAESKRLDFVLLQVGLGEAAVRVPPLARYVRAGERVTSFWVSGRRNTGARVVSGITCREGSVYRAAKDEVGLRGDRLFFPGSSGAPVFDARGEAAAIALEMVNWKPGTVAGEWTYTALPVAAALAAPKLPAPLPLGRFMARLRGR
jgi:hypothetical protein